MSLAIAEAEDVARHCADAYRRMAQYYREAGHDAAQADALARLPSERIAGTPSHELDWFGLNGLLERDAPAAQAVWERVKADAAGYVAGGSNVAEALGYVTPWQRAQFVALRAAVHADWQPAGAVEVMVLDTYVAAHLAYLHWLGRLHERDLVPLPAERTTDALDQAAVMADRFHRQMVRALRAMRDLRRYNVTITGNVEQLNVGGQQVNVRSEQR